MVKCLPFAMPVFLWKLDRYEECQEVKKIPEPTEYRRLASDCCGWKLAKASMRGCTFTAVLSWA